MDIEQRWRQLEKQIPAEQLRPSVAFPLCCPSAERAVQLDELQGADFVRALLNILWVQSKIRTILECWCILMMRSRLQSEEQKDEVYDLLFTQPPSKTSLSPLCAIEGEGSKDGIKIAADDTGVVASTKTKSKTQREAEKKQKTRWRRGVVVLAHLLIDRTRHGGNSLLDTYLNQVFFPWSVATERSLDFLLSSRVIEWIEAARSYFIRERGKIDCRRWVELCAVQLSPIITQPQEEESRVQDRQDSHKAQEQVEGSSESSSVATLSSPFAVGATEARAALQASTLERRRSARTPTSAQLIQTLETHQQGPLVSKMKKRARSAGLSHTPIAGRRRLQYTDDHGSRDDISNISDDSDESDDSDGDENGGDTVIDRWKQREAALVAVFTAWARTIKQRLLQAIAAEQADKLESVKAIAMELEAPPIDLTGKRRDKEEGKDNDVHDDNTDWLIRGWVELYDERHLGGQGVRALRDIPLPSSKKNSAVAVAADLHQAGEQFIRNRSEVSEQDPTYHIFLNRRMVFDARHHWVGKINHLPTPHCNVRLNKTGKLMQIKSISTGEALSLDYGVEYWVYRVTGIELDEWLASESAEGRRGLLELFRSMHENVRNYSPLLQLGSLTVTSTMLEKEIMLEAIRNTLSECE